MYIKYGSLQHTPAEASLARVQVKANYSPRGFRVTSTATMTVSGEICAAPGETQYDIAARINTLEAAYSVDGQDWGLYHDNNTLTPHFLQSAHPNSLTGNQITERSFPSGHGGEFTTGRDFGYAVRNTFVTPDTQLLEYTEQVSHRGTTGPVYQWHENHFGVPYFGRDSASSIQTITQHGRAVTLSTWFLPTPPMIPSPTATGFELEHLREIKRTGPRRFPQHVFGYITEWTYVFQSSVIVPGFPTVR